MAEAQLVDVQARLTEGAFIHGNTISAVRDTMMAKLYYHIASDSTVKVDGVGIDTAANRKYVMYMNQYHSYCDTFGLRPPILQPSGRETGIGGSRREQAQRRFKSHSSILV